ncbi:MAG: hypothetical protein DBX59_06555 [Bacillota bacterium]|nr:MAG: hypothetical protein DBX59_06555 [Bacillota bacterium]
MHAKKILKKADVAAFGKYLAAFAAMTLFGGASPTPLPLQLPLFAALLYVGFSPVVTPALFILSFVLTAGELLAPMAIGGAFLTAVFFIYRAAGAKPKLELVLYVSAALIPYYLMNGAHLYVKIAAGVSTAVFTAVCIPALKSALFKRLKYKSDFEEIAALAICTAVLGVGVHNLLHPAVWKILAIFVILGATHLYAVGVSTTIAALLGTSAAIYYGDLSYIGLYVFLALAALSLSGVSRYLSAAVVPLADFAAVSLFHIAPYGVADALFAVGGALIFCVFPTKFLTELKEKLYLFREKQLIRQTVNRNRSILSNRLYELSGVFLEIGKVLTDLKRSGPDESVTKKHLLEEIYSSVCAECDNRARCKAKKVPSEIALDKLLNIGMAKGKVSFIDMPREISDNCIRANNMLFCVNKMLAEYRGHLVDELNYDKSRQLIAGQALGIAEILKGLAFETGQTLKYRNNLERKLSSALKKGGVIADEVMIYGDGANVNVSLILCGEELPVSKLERIASAALSCSMRVAERALVQEDKIYVMLCVGSRYDAVFGVASAKKDGSAKCGDTHCVERLDGDKFLIALSDGMGSGEYAETISDASLSLIESFYKAGMSSPLIMNTVNKLLAVNTEDSFAALDVCVFDLNTLAADFIKFGAPYGFILTADGIKIVEGSSLPMGILDDLAPSITSDTLRGDDVLLFVTDGVSDAFGNASSIIDFLQKQPAKNPQTLANDVLGEALRISGGEKADDMTCLAVRVFEKKTA